jgi:hypothetical protein
VDTPFGASLLSVLSIGNFLHFVKLFVGNFLLFFVFFTILIYMTGITIDEICKELSLPFKTVEARIQRAGIKPLTRQAVYPSETLDAIRAVKMGRPPKQEPPENAPKKSKAGK